MFGKTAVVSRHADVLDVLDRDREFTIAEINETRMQRADAAFILGWDRSPRYDFEAGILRRVLQPADLETIRRIVSDEARALVGGSKQEGRLEIVGGLTRVVPTRIVARFFGAPGPNEQVMMRWLRVLFDNVFLNRSNLPEVARAANQYSGQLRDYLTALIAARKSCLTSASDDFLTRLLRLQRSGGDCLDDDGVRRNISGIIVGAVDTTSAAVAQAIDVLLDRSSDLERAARAAKDDDVDTVAKILFDALRFSPQTGGLLRFCRQGATVAAGTSRETKIPAGSTILLSTLSAMFDPGSFPDPNAIRLDRDSHAYLHFGHGMHTCYGRQINLVQIPNIAMALLKLKGLRRARGRLGRLAYDGPFPDRLVVEFDL